MISQEMRMHYMTQSLVTVKHELQVIKDEQRQFKIHQKLCHDALFEQNRLIIQQLKDLTEGMHQRGLDNISEPSTTSMVNTILANTTGLLPVEFIQHKGSTLMGNNLTVDYMTLMKQVDANKIFEEKVYMLIANNWEKAYSACSTETRKSVRKKKSTWVSVIKVVKECANGASFTIPEDNKVSLEEWKLLLKKGINYAVNTIAAKLETSVQKLTVTAVYNGRKIVMDGPE